MKWLTNILNKCKLAREEAVKIEAAWEYWGLVERSYQSGRIVNLPVCVNKLSRQAYYLERGKRVFADYNALLIDKAIAEV